MPSDRPDAAVFSRAAPSPAAVRSARATRSGRTFRLRAGESLEARRLLAAVPVGDLKVTVRVNNAVTPEDVVRQYSAGSIGSGGWDKVNNDGSTSKFLYVETHQFAVKDLGASIKVKVMEIAGNGIDSQKYPGFAAFWKNEPLLVNGSKYMKWGTEFSTKSVTANDPVQLTIIPFNGTVYMPSKAYAIWLSPHTTNAGANHHTVSADVGWTTETDKVGELGLVKPHWIFDESVTPNTLSYVGSLNEYNFGGKLHGQPVALTLNDKVTLDLPLTNSVATMVLPKLTDAQRRVLHNLDKDQDVSDLTTADKNVLRSITISKTDKTHYLNFPAQKLTNSVYINGLGRINGFSVYKVPEFLKTKQLPDKHWFDNESKSRTMTLFDQILTGQYMIRSALVEIKSTKEIHVEGISVSYGPVRHQETIQLASDAKTTLFDVKTPGTFRGASDGPVVLSPGASLSYLYLQHADDSIKVFNTDQHFKDITLIQGNIGGAIDIGAYGFNSPIKSASVTGVYIHRIVQGDSGYDGLNGVITTRNKAWGKEISNVKISGVDIVNLGTNGPNVYFRKTAIGFVPGGPFGDIKQAKDTTISNLKIEPFTGGLAPRDKVVYNYNVKGYYVRGAGRLQYNLVAGQDKAFPSDKNFSKTPQSQQYGIFVDVIDNS